MPGVNTDFRVTCGGLGEINDAVSVANDASGGVNTVYLFFPLILPLRLVITGYMNGASGDGFPLLNVKDRAGTYRYMFSLYRQPIQSGSLPVDTEGDTYTLDADVCRAIFSARMTADAPLAVQFGNINGIYHSVHVVGVFTALLTSSGQRSTPDRPGLIRSGLASVREPVSALAFPRKRFLRGATPAFVRKRLMKSPFRRG